MWIGGYWFSKDGEKFIHFLFSVTVLGFIWPISITIALIIATADHWQPWFGRQFEKLHFVRRWKERKQQEAEYDDDRLERMGLRDRDEIWSTYSREVSG
jgi:hypothetical protein